MSRLECGSLRSIGQSLRCDALLRYLDGAGENLTHSLNRDTVRSKTEDSNLVSAVVFHPDNHTVPRAARMLPKREGRPLMQADRIMKGRCASGRVKHVQSGILGCHCFSLYQRLKRDGAVGTNQRGRSLDCCVMRVGVSPSFSRLRKAASYRSMQGRWSTAQVFSWYQTCCPVMSAGGQSEQ